jgi:hypothetical protein
MRIKYTDAPPHWGNLVGPCKVPPDARALRFFVYKRSAAPKATLHIWLLEPDKDGWVQRVPFEKGLLSDLPVGWHEVRMSVAAFRFEPRGKKTREMTSVNRMLIGCNFGDLEVTVDSMTWETGPTAKPLPLPRTEALKIVRGVRGSVGILDMRPGLPKDFVTAHPPEKLASALREAPAIGGSASGGGFGATILKAGDIADPKVLTRGNFDCIILPFGPFFPLDAKEVFLAYLKAGGPFLSTDGYAFDEMVLLTEQGWTAVPPERTASEMNRPEIAPKGAMNTRIGKPGDQMSLAPNQIGVFDPSFPLEHATQFRPAGSWAKEEQLLGLRYDFEQPVKGFSACGLTGYTSAVFPPVYRRWLPVLNAFNAESGALRGGALSIMHNYAGPFAGSSWAFSGLTSGEDLFLGTRERRLLLQKVVSAITDKVFLHELSADLVCYRKGETASLQVRVSNNGKASTSVSVALVAGGREVTAQDLSLAPSSTATVQGSIAVDQVRGDFGPVQAILRRDGRVIDTMESGFCVWDEKVIASGPKIGWKDNYMTVDGRPTFLVGTNQTGMMFFSANENPAVWDRDFRAMAEHDFHILRILHFSPFACGGYDGKPYNVPAKLVDRPERLCRQMDAIVQLAQKHRVAIFLSLHDWMGIVLTDEELAAQADWNRFWASRYKNVPGVFYDVQNEPSLKVEDRPDVLALWNKWLNERYGSDEALRTAWTKNPPEAPLPKVPLGKRTEDWDDVRSADLKRFETELLNRWIKANVDGIKAGDPDALTTVGFLQTMSPADKILGSRYTDFSNMHSYSPPSVFPQEFKLIDRRCLGKGLSLGEMGAREAHDSRVNGRFELATKESIERFNLFLHYTAGLGGAFICNWDWKDFDEMVFPWGLVRHCSNIPKPWLHTFTQGGLLLSFVEPVYESPEVFVLAPDSHRIGPRFNELDGALERSVELMLDQRVNFGVVNEEDVAHLPPFAKALVWPIPYCPDDKTFDHVGDWVKAGGALYLSGDISFDHARKPTRIQRRRLLGLPEITPASPFATPETAWEQTPIETSVGKGKVLFVPYPLELRKRDSDAAIYSRFIALSGAKRIRIEPESAPVRALSIPTRDGGRLTMLARTTPGEDLLTVSLPDHNASVQLSGNGFAFVTANGKGNVVAAESQGSIVLRGQGIAEAKGHFGLCALDGEALSRSTQVLVLPHQEQNVRLIGLAGVEGGKCYLGPPTGKGGKVIPFAGSITFPPGPEGYVAVVAKSDLLETGIELLKRRLELRNPTKDTHQERSSHMNKKVEGEHGVVCRLPGERFGYFGWPTIARMEDGTLVVASSGLRTEHVCPFGKTVLNFSKDDGKTWSPPQVINDSPLDDRDAGVISLGGKSLLVTWFTSDTRQYFSGLRKKMSPDNIAAWEKILNTWTDEVMKQWLGSWVLIMDDRQTWSKPIRVPVTAPHGPIRLSNGDLLYLGKLRSQTGDLLRTGEIVACRSKDGGRTWTPLGSVPVCDGTRLVNYYEPHVVEIEGGKLIGMIRFQYHGKDDPAKDQINFTIFQTESEDGGKTWAKARPTGVHGSPPHLLRHSSGKVICVYGCRRPPYGQRAMISADGGKTWETDWILRDDGPDSDLGYPASVEMPDGSIFTIYYQKYKAGEKCSLLWTRWRLP